MTASYVNSLRRFLERKEAEAEERRAVFLSRLEKAVMRLVKRFPAITNVAVIDSFLTPVLFGSNSGINVVVRDLPTHNYFAALALLERELQVPTHLIRREEMPKYLRLRLKTARVLYAR